jgi:hypothetical protein
MAELITFRTELVEGDKSPRLGVALSVALHVIIFVALFVAFNRVVSPEIVAAGPGEGGEGGIGLPPRVHHLEIAEDVLDGLFRTNESMSEIFWSSSGTTKSYALSFTSRRTTG